MFDDTRNDGGGDDDDEEFYRRHFQIRITNYILDGHTPMPVLCFKTWAHWFETADRKVARTRVRGLTISTVFVGLDAAFNGPPLLFETGVFTGRVGGEMIICYRSSTWAEAKAQHGLVVRMATMARSGRVMARQTFNSRAYLRKLFAPWQASD